VARRGGQLNDLLDDLPLCEERVHLPRRVVLQPRHTVIVETVWEGSIDAPLVVAVVAIGVIVVIATWLLLSRTDSKR
jgi:hypothetical protein